RLAFVDLNLKFVVLLHDELSVPAQSPDLGQCDFARRARSDRPPQRLRAQLSGVTLDGKLQPSYVSHQPHALAEHAAPNQLRTELEPHPPELHVQADLVSIEAHRGSI